MAWTPCTTHADTWCEKNTCRYDARPVVNACFVFSNKFILVVVATTIYIMSVSEMFGIVIKYKHHEILDRRSIQCMCMW
jgi:hypothetical protein